MRRFGALFFACYFNGTFNLPKRPNIELIECTAYTSGNWYLWYKRYSNGFIQQGGVYNGTLVNSNDGTSEITFPKAFSNANYSLTFAPQYSNSMNGKWFADSHSASGFRFHSYSLAGNFRVNPFWWQASGYSSSPNPGNNKIIKYI